MKSAQNKFDITFIFLFLFLLIIPCLKIDFSSTLSEKENRTLAEYEHLFVNGKINLNYSKAFESWFNDRFFCRNLLLAINQKLKLTSSSSAKSHNELVLKGKDGWYFYRGDKSEANYMNKSVFTDEQMQSILKYLTDIEAWCKEHGKSFIFFIAPDKNKIYGEFYPDIIKKARPDSESRTRKFIQYAKENGFSVIYPLDKLLLEKESGNLLYYKNDTHWDDYGAYIGYKEVEKVLSAECGIVPLTVDKWENRFHETGDLNNLWPEGTVSDTESLYPYSIFDSKYQVSPENPANERDGYFTSCAGKELKAIVFRDSFCTALKQYISNDFSEVQYHWRRNVQKSDLKNLEENADVVIFEIVERYLPELARLNFPVSE